MSAFWMGLGFCLFGDLVGDVVLDLSIRSRGRRTKVDTVTATPRPPRLFFIIIDHFVCLVHLLRPTPSTRVLRMMWRCFCTETQGCFCCVMISVYFLALSGSPRKVSIKVLRFCWGARVFAVRKSCWTGICQLSLFHFETEIISMIPQILNISRQISLRATPSAPGPF